MVTTLSHVRINSINKLHVLSCSRSKITYRAIVQECEGFRLDRFVVLFSHVADDALRHDAVQIPDKEITYCETDDGKENISEQTEKWRQITGRNHIIDNLRSVQRFEEKQKGPQRGQGCDKNDEMNVWLVIS